MSNTFKKRIIAVESPGQVQARFLRVEESNLIPSAVRNSFKAQSSGVSHPLQRYGGRILRAVFRSDAVIPHLLAPIGVLVSTIIYYGLSNFYRRESQSKKSS